MRVNALKCVLICMLLASSFSVARAAEIRMSDEQALQMVFAAEAKHIFEPFLAEYRRAIEEAKEIVPFAVDFDDTPNLEDQVVRFRAHIVSLIEAGANAAEGKSGEANPEIARIAEYKGLLKRFDDEYFVYKAEFVQCLTDGDDLSKDARGYAWRLFLELSPRISELTNKKEFGAELRELGGKQKFYSALLSGMSIKQYYEIEQRMALKALQDYRAREKETK